MTGDNEHDGLSYLRAIVDGRIPQAPISGILGFQITGAEAGAAVFEGGAGQELCNPMGTVHGGYLATLLDSAMGSAVLTMLPAGMAYATAQFNVNLLRPVPAGADRLRAAGTAIHVGRSLATAEARLTGVQDGKLYAHATATCAVFPAQ